MKEVEKGNPAQTLPNLMRWKVASILVAESVPGPGRGPVIASVLEAVDMTPDDVKTPEVCLCILKEL